MSAQNNTQLIGRLTRNFEGKYTPNGQFVANGSLAVDTGYTKDGERVKRTEFYDITAWGKTGETLNQYCVKGQFMVFQGTLKARGWLDNEKVVQVRQSLDVREFTFGPKPGGAATEGPATPLSDEDIPF